MPVASAMTIVNATPADRARPDRAAAPGCDRRRARAGRDGTAPRRQPGEAAGGREHQAFGEHLAHQPAALGAKRGAHADLALARGASRQQQVGDVDARDEQHERDRADQREQRRPQLADHLLLQRKSITVRRALRCGSSFSSSA